MQLTGKCPICGKFVSADQAFCDGCGADLRKCKCPVCGKEVDQQAAFCKFCGAQLTKKPAERIVVYDRTPVVKPQQPEPQRRIHPAVWVAIIAAVVIVILVIALVSGNRNQAYVPPASNPQSNSGQQASSNNTSNNAPTGQATSCSHSWRAATCQAAETCSKCNAVRGSVVDHSWIPATHTKPKTCSVCGATEGSALSAPNISVSDQEQWIRDQYYPLREDMDDGKLNCKESGGVYYYYDSRGEVRAVVVARGTKGLGTYSSQYSRSYYFVNGELIFAYFEGSDAHRLYFYQGDLMRWRYRKDATSNTDKTIEDFTYSADFLKWEELALQEVASFVTTIR